MISRRNIFKGFGLLFLPCAIDSKLIELIKSERVVKWEGTLTLDQVMTWDQFCVKILDSLDTRVTDKLRDGLKEEGRLLRSETKFSGKTVQWTYYFKDQESLLYWIKETESKAFKEDFVCESIAGNVTTVSKFEINMNAPELVIA